MLAGSNRLVKLCEKKVNIFLIYPFNAWRPLKAYTYFYYDCYDKKGNTQPRLRKICDAMNHYESQIDNCHLRKYAKKYYNFVYIMDFDPSNGSENFLDCFNCYI